ncbi:olfactory receptor 11A1-like [Pelobates fuscus]|uniref:olfactory receptor 11A1-like n=1 Tax=Pelobates fuscus TaxID=191477 RepID=UPI002FE4E7FE
MNQTIVKEFIFRGFEIHNYHLKMLTFIIFLMVYTATVIGNLLIIVLVYNFKHLHSPMYIFLSNLSLSDILFTTNIVPNLLYLILEDLDNTISFNACVLQFYIYGMLGSTECFFLTTMSYDRYLAICNPLYYHSVMNITLQKQLITFSWVTSSIVTLFPVILIYQLHFCGPNIIDHFFCDIAPLLELACSSTTALKMETLISSIYVVLMPFLFIISTYFRIIKTILNIKSAHGRQNTFSTCSSHLVVVSTHFLTIITVYSIPTTSYTSSANKIRSLLYIVGTPLFNPIIYSLRNKEVKMALLQLSSLKTNNSSAIELPLRRTKKSSGPHLFG